MYSMLSRKLSSVQFAILGIVGLHSGFAYLCLAAYMYAQGKEMYAIVAVVHFVVDLVLACMFMQYSDRKAIES